MRKFKVTKKWPNGPSEGEVLEQHEMDKKLFSSNNSFAYSEKELQGFVEEIKEPEEFWFVELDGKVVSSEQVDDYDSVAKEFRFPTEFHAQAFADFMSTRRSIAQCPKASNPHSHEENHHKAEVQVVSA